MKWCIYILCIATIPIITLDNQSIIEIASNAINQKKPENKQVCYRTMKAIAKVLLGVKFKVFKKDATKIYDNLIKRYRYLSDLNEYDQIKTIIEVEKGNEEKKRDINNLFLEINKNIQNKAKLNVFAVFIKTLAGNDHYFILNVYSTNQICLLQSFMEGYTLEDTKNFVQCFPEEKLITELLSQVHKKRMEASKNLFTYAFLDEKKIKIIKNAFQAGGMLNL